MKVELVGTFYTNQSLSVVNRNLAINLSKLQNEDFRLCITPIDSYRSEYKIDKAQVKELKKLEDAKLDDIDVQLRHSYPPIWRWPSNPNTKVVFIQPWEFSKVPYEWINQWQYFADGIIAPSHWVAARYLESGVDPYKIMVINNGYDPKIFNKVPEDSHFFDNKKFTFTFLGCSQFRKGIDILMQAWHKVFTKADLCQLVIIDTVNIYGGNNLLDEILRMQYRTGCAKIVYIDDILSQKELANIFKNTTVLVHPFRGEGFGMHILEAAACGAFPLVSDNGPPSEFLKQENRESAWFIQTRQQAINLADTTVFAAKSGDSFSLMSQHGWVQEPILDDLANKMRLLYHYKTKEGFKELTRDIIYPQTWDTIALGYLEALKRVNSFDGITRKTIKIKENFPDRPGPMEPFKKV